MRRGCPFVDKPRVRRKKAQDMEKEDSLCSKTQKEQDEKLMRSYEG